MTADKKRWEPPSMKLVQQLEGNPLVDCVCGRRVNADMMRPFGDGFACDSCHEAKFRSGELSREDFARSHGAPDEVVIKAREQDVFGCEAVAVASAADTSEIEVDAPLA